MTATTSTAPEIVGLDGDRVFPITNTPARLDTNALATITAGSSALASLELSIWGGEATDRLGISTTSTVSLPFGMVNGGKVVVQGTETGKIYITNSYNIQIVFNTNATTTLVEHLIHALNYTTTASTTGFVSKGFVRIKLFDQTNAYAQADVAIADNIAGTIADETFTCTGQTLSVGDVINGGGGNDTLKFGGGMYYHLDRVGSISNIETLLGSTADDVIRLKAGQTAGDLGQLKDIKTIDGGGHGNNGDTLQIVGSWINLSGTTITDFAEITLMDNGATITLDNINTAKLVTAHFSDNATLILTNGVLTTQERQQLHRQGVETIVNNGVTTTAHAPVVTGLNGDHVSAMAGSIAFLDAGRNAAIVEDEGSDVLTDLYVAGDDAYGGDDRIGIDTSGAVSLSGGFTDGSKVSIRTINGLVEIGEIDGTPGSNLHVAFNDNASAPLVMSLIRSLTYKYVGAAPSSALPHKISLQLKDMGQRFTDIEINAHVTHVLRGTSSKNTLKGGNGNDIIYGKSGNDTLYGYGGADIFVFDTKLGTSSTDRKVNFDKVVGYNVAADSFWLDNKYFTKLGKSGSISNPKKLSSSFFKTGTKAKDKNDYIVYDNKKGILYYDPDGSGSKNPIEIAQLSKNLRMNYKEFFVI